MPPRKKKLNEGMDDLFGTNFSFERSAEVRNAVKELASSGVEERGVVFTKREVVDFILDISGYTVDSDLLNARLLEPSFGNGAFLLPALERLLTVYLLRVGRDLSNAVSLLENTIKAVELHEETFRETSNRCQALLIQYGLSEGQVAQLLSTWLVNDDYLLADIEGGFTHVIGNPPYVRQELIPAPLLKEYRRRYKTVYDRADLYVPFFERSIGLLSNEGKCAFICSNRWVKNKYGARLRGLIARTCHLEIYVDMVGAPAFDQLVNAYPAITILSRLKGLMTRIVQRPLIEKETLLHLAELIGDVSATDGSRFVDVENIVNGEEPWITGSPDAVRVLRKIESTFPLLEQTGCSVGIGVATGCDEVYIQRAEDLPIEEDRKVPLLLAQDIRNGEVEWSGRYVLNPYAENGELVSLATYPLLSDYLHKHEGRIKNRDTAKNHPNKWYKTIDRIYNGLQGRPKLVLPDIKGAPNVVYDKGEYYPHHNLYYIVASDWDLLALRAILRSAVSEFFVAMYSEAMRGGYLRFQAQYIRRVRIPEWNTLASALKQKLIHAGQQHDQHILDDVAFEVYSLNDSEIDAILRTLGRKTAIGFPEPLQVREQSGGQFLVRELDVEALTRSAVTEFWSARLPMLIKGTIDEDLEEREISNTLAETTDPTAVRRDLHMVGFHHLISEVVKASGLSGAAVFAGRSNVTLPGFFRPTKDWDLLVIHRDVVVAVLELKSQIHSSKTEFGKNINNRIEEGLGSITDLRAGLRNKAFNVGLDLPFVGFLMLLEDCSESRTPSGDAWPEPHFMVFPEYVGASVAQRYQYYCEKLMDERLYTAALVVSPRDLGRAGAYSSLSQRTSLKQFLIRLAAHVWTVAHQID